MLYYISNDFLNNTGELGRRKSFEAFLNHVIPVLILNTLHDLLIKFCNHFLLNCWEFLQFFQRLLNHSTPVRMQREIFNIPFDLTYQFLFLFKCSYTNERKKYENKSDIDNPTFLFKRLTNFHAIDKIIGIYISYHSPRAFE